MKKKLEKKINLFLSLIIIMVLLPLIVTIICQRMQLETLMPSVFSIEESTQEAVGEGETETADTNSGDDKTRIIGIVAKEISVNYSEEAIKAQCVIARTNLYDARKNGTQEPEALSIEEMQNLWGESFGTMYQNLEKYVAITEHDVLTWNGRYIYAAYHAVSGGKTRNMSELYEDAQMPYLTETACHDDTMADGYLAVLYWENAEFLELCRKQFPEAVIEDATQIQVASRDSTDYVITVQIGNLTCTGEEFRSKMSLNSSCFTITGVDGQVRIVTKGRGHGYGLSQYTANLLAQEGNNYKEILEYFYPGAEISTVGAVN